MDEHTAKVLERARRLTVSSEWVEKTIWGSPAGKKRLAKRLVKMLPPHKTYVEPFAGSAAVLFAKEPAEVEGVEHKQKRRFLEDLSMADADFLVDEFDRVDCGVDTTIEIECPDCYEVQDVELPFDKGFFLPGKARKKRRKAHTSSFLE